LVRWSVRRPVGRSVGVRGGRGEVGRSVSQMASQNSPMLVSRLIGRFVQLRVGPRCRSRGPRTIAPAPGATPRASLRFCLPQVGHTSGFTAAARCPRWGHHSEARGVPHPPPSSGYRTRCMSLEASGTLGRRESGASSGLIVLVTHGLVVDPSHLKPSLSESNVDAAAS
jgi:hypothetical protein